MLPLLGLVLLQCESGRLIKEIQIAKYSPSCCSGESYATFDGLTPAMISGMNGSYVTVVPDSSQGDEYPPSAYLIANNMSLFVRVGSLLNETYLFLSYQNIPSSYPPNEMSDSSSNYSFGANTNHDIYVNYLHVSNPATFRIYANECNFPPPHPPPPIPPPTTAMCHEGYWPLYQSESEANAMSSLGTAHVHTFGGVGYYMPNGFEGATHGESIWCPWHTTTIIPRPPPTPSPPPSTPSPTTPPSAPPSPPPYELPVYLQLAILMISVVALTGLMIWFISYNLHYDDVEETTTRTGSDRSYANIVAIK